MSETFDPWKLAAGLGIFLVGMFMLEEGVKVLSGKSFRRMIRLHTHGRLRAIGSGTLVTALLQSSSAVSLMVLAFVGAGVMSMQNAIGVVMGSNIGTTLTIWIVAILGFKLKIESFALPLIGLGGIGLIFFAPSTRKHHAGRLLIGFGFLFLGLDYMKGSVESIGRNFDLSMVPTYGLWIYLLAGTLLTAVMQSSSASIAVVLTALNSGLITFDIGVAMVIGANVGTTITIILGSLGGIPAKKRVAFSHLVFNVVTGVAAYFSISILVWLIVQIVDIPSNGVMGLALFHTLFNLMGVLLFLPFIGLLTQQLYRLFPDRKLLLTRYINNTPAEVIEAAASALRQEILHLLQQCQLYGSRLLHIEPQVSFAETPELLKKIGKTVSLERLYEDIKLLHAEIFAYYSRLQSQKLEEGEAKELERMVYASRNIMNSIKNFKGIRHDFDEFEAADNTYLDSQLALFRQRLAGLYREMDAIRKMESREAQYQHLLKLFVKVEAADKLCISETLQAVAEGRIKKLEISSMLLVNRLFTQGCRLQIFSLKDLLLSQALISNFDHALDMKEILEEEKGREQEGPPAPETAAENL
ncbi:MAG: Na/Pi cotransporter family protein [Deltaproteobacteria bacterium]|jgi:phosphate:Na+ symporter|nr:Na/Pi cotransporter family protein [Deltaproteobacteria bacterium]